MQVGYRLVVGTGGYVIRTVHSFVVFRNCQNIRSEVIHFRREVLNIQEKIVRFYPSIGLTAETSCGTADCFNRFHGCVVGCNEIAKVFTPIRSTTVS